MGDPVKPPILAPGKAYIHITSPLPPTTIAEQITHGEYKVKYVGPVGELQGEHIFQVESRDGNLVSRSELPDSEIFKAVKAVNGVKGVTVLETRQRAKRDEF